MAGLKKPSRKKESGSPGLVLIIFLVFFVLLSIGLGVWGYYGYAGQEKLLADAKSAKSGADSAKKGEDFYRLAAYNYRLAFGVGDPLTPDEKIDYEGLLKEYQEGNKFKDPSFEKATPVLQKVMAENKKNLGDKDNGKDYAETYKAKIDKLEADLTTAQASLKTREEELDAAKKKFDTLLTSQDAYWKKALTKIDNGNTASLAVSSKQTVAMTKSLEEVASLNQEVQNLTREKNDLKEQLERKIKILENKVVEVTAQKPQAASFTRNATDVHALLLDISSGKPLWDNPLGKLTHVDMGKREVTINLGSDDGVQPEATFTVFGAGANGRAEKGMKATLEVVRVAGPHASVARITALYDEKGVEVDPNQLTQQRIQRESESALREGDLVHNMFWGSHVALAGPVSLTGRASENPVAQMRQLEDFRYHLGRMGIAVDAYLDLTDGQIKGALTPQTRYMIRADLTTAPKAKAKAKDEEAEGKEAGKSLADTMKAFRLEAIDKGLFIISDENFLIVSGYRRPLSGIAHGASAFRPSAPSAGVPIPGLFATPARK